MKKTIFAFLIVAIVTAAVILLLVKYPRTDIQETGTLPPADTVMIPNAGINAQVPPEIAAGKLLPGSRPAPSAATLSGTTWVWEKTVMADGTITAPKKENTFSIAFGADGRLLGKTDCNGFFGTYKIGSDGVITFGPLASTLMYCESSQEGEFTKSFADVVRYTSDSEQNLTLLLKDDSGAIVFTKK